MRVLALLAISILCVAAEDLSSEDREWVFELIAPSREVEQLRQRYLEDPHVSGDIKNAIRQRLVSPGMCPLEAIAAAGLPLEGAIRQPGERPSDRSPAAIIAAQCARPETETGVLLSFRNDTQFGPGVVFRVCFWEGRAIAIDTKKFTPACWEEI